MKLRPKQLRRVNKLVEENLSKAQAALEEHLLKESHSPAEYFFCLASRQNETSADVLLWVSLMISPAINGIDEETLLKSTAAIITRLVEMGELSKLLMGYAKTLAVEEARTK